MRPLPTFPVIVMLLPFLVMRQEEIINVSGKTERFVTPTAYMITPTPGPKYFKSSLRLSMNLQDGKTCLPSIMAYINAEMCKGKRSTGYYVDAYEDQHPGVDVSQDGIIGSRQDLMHYIESVFETRSYHASGGIVASINAGHPMLTTIPVYDNTGAEQMHNILIVGYDSAVLNNPKVYYMDSRYGRIFNDINVASFNESSPAYIYSITGCK